MGLFESAINYFRRLAPPYPTLRAVVSPPEEEGQPLHKRTRIRRAVQKAHRRVVGRLKQPPKHGTKR